MKFSGWQTAQQRRRRRGRNGKESGRAVLQLRTSEVSRLFLLFIFTNKKSAFRSSSPRGNHQQQQQQYGDGHKFGAAWSDRGRGRERRGNGGYRRGDYRNWTTPIPSSHSRYNSTPSLNHHPQSTPVFRSEHLKSLFFIQQTLDNTFYYLNVCFCLFFGIVKWSFSLGF